MDYSDYDDGELYMLICEDDEVAKEVLFNKYKYLIDIIIKKYLNMASLLGLDYKDLYSEALIGFTDAINNYDENKQSSIKTFLSLCISSRLQKIIAHANTKKNKINIEAYSLDHTYDDLGVTLSDVISDDQKNDPLMKILDNERTSELIKKIKGVLSSFENQVFDLLINNFDYIEIAKLLEKTPKQIDNTIQRLKGKVKLIIKD